MVGAGPENSSDEVCSFGLWLVFACSFLDGMENMGAFGHLNVSIILVFQDESDGDVVLSLRFMSRMLKNAILHIL